MHVGDEAPQNVPEGHTPDREPPNSVIRGEVCAHLEPDALFQGKDAEEGGWDPHALGVSRVSRQRD